MKPDPPTLGLHWIQGSFGCDNFEYVAKLLTELFGEPAESHGGLYLPRGVRFGELDAHVYYKSTEVGEKDSAGFVVQPGKMVGFCMVEVRGAACDDLDEDDVVKLFATLEHSSMKCTRVDVAADVLDEDMPAIKQITERYYDTGRYGPYRIGSHWGSGDGVTQYFGKSGRAGAKQCTVFYRFHDPAAHGRNGPRVEARFFADKANEAFKYLCGRSVGALCSGMGQLVGGSVDLYEDDATHVGRRREAPWWRALREAMGGAVRMRRRVEREPTIEKMMRQLRKSCGIRLAVVKRYHENRGLNFASFIESCVEHGEQRAGQQMAVAGNKVEVAWMEKQELIPF